MRHSAPEAFSLGRALRKSAALMLLLGGAASLLGGCGRSNVGTTGSSTSPPAPAPANFTLSVSLVGSGTVTSSPAAINCGANCSESIPSGTSTTLTAVAASGYSFSGWSGSGIACPGTGTCTVTMSTARTVMATFSQNQAANYTLGITLAGSGTVTSSPAGVNCPGVCSESVSSGTSVTLTALAASGYSFSGWSVNGTSCPGTGTCTVTMSAARTVAATFVTASADLCQGLAVDDKTLHPMTPLAKPALGQTVTDPEFGTTIRRITAVPNPGDVITTLYSTVSAWNADESYLMLLRVNGGAHVLYDGKTYQYIRDLNISPPDIEQVFWHTTDPDVFFYVDNALGLGHAQLIRYHVGADRKEVLKTFSECTGSVSSGSDPVFNSWDSNFFSFLCSNRPNGGGDQVFIYQVDTGTILTMKPATASGIPPRLGPSGTLALWDANVTDMFLNTLRPLSILNPNEHTNNGQLANGHDTFNTVIFDPPAGGADNDYVGTLTTYDLTDASWRVIIGPKTGYPYPYDTHVSAMTTKNPGWVVISSADVGSLPTPTGHDLLALELVYADTNTGRVCRVAHHRAWGKLNTTLTSFGTDPYFAEAHSVPSPSGTRIVFASDWNNGNTVDAYVVELPGYKP